jgi:hypothetical protein
MSTTGKWLLRAALTALAVLITTDRPRIKPSSTPKKPAE